MTTYRQGDVLFIEVTVNTVKKENKKDRILVEGEATGHHHAVAECDFKNCEIYIDENGKMILENSKPVKIEHQEHKTINLPVGKWEVRRQQELFPDGWRQVRD